MEKLCSLTKELCKTLEIPLIVIGRDPQYSITQLTNGGMPKRKQHNLKQCGRTIHEQLQLSIHSQYILAEHAGHGIEIDRPDIIIGAVQSL